MEQVSEICNICMKLIPTKQISTKHHCPWITTSLKRLTRKKQRAYNRAWLTNLQTDWLRYHNIKKQSQQNCCLAYSKLFQKQLCCKKRQGQESASY